MSKEPNLNLYRTFGDQCFMSMGNDPSVSMSGLDRTYQDACVRAFSPAPDKKRLDILASGVNQMVDFPCSADILPKI